MGGSEVRHARGPGSAAGLRGRRPVAGRRRQDGEGNNRARNTQFSAHISMILTHCNRMATISQSSRTWLPTTPCV